MEAKNIAGYSTLIILLVASLGFNVTDFDMIDDEPTHQCITDNFKAFLNCDEGVTASGLTCKRSFGTNKRCTGSSWEPIDYPVIESPKSNNLIKYNCDNKGCTEI